MVLSNEQRRAVDCYLLTRDVDAAASAAGCRAATLSQWLTMPHFVAALLARQEEQLEAATADLVRDALALADAANRWNELRKRVRWCKHPAVVQQDKACGTPPKEAAATTIAASE